MHIVIIGNGIAGITTARHVRKQSDHKITVISSESKYFFSRTALMYVYMGHMKFEHTQPYENWFWKKNKIDLVYDRVLGIDTDKKTLQVKSGSEISYDKLVLALGSVPRPLPTPGANLKGVQPLYSKQNLEQLEETTRYVKHAVVIGGGLIGIELAEMLHSRGIHVTMAVREKNYWDMVLPKEEAEMVERHVKARNINLKLGITVDSINGSDKVESVTLSTGEIIDSEFVGATIGVMPNIKLLEGTSIETNQGILVDDYLQTSVPDIYAIGDCAEIRKPDPGRRAIEAVWYAGRIMGETLAQTLYGSPTPYHPGIWYNSAKFMDLEYQTYGQVPTSYHEEIESLYWQDQKAERCLRVTYEKATKKVKGFNVLGLRLRHQLCDKWIVEERSIEYVLEHLEDLNFDPEFYKDYLFEAKLNLEVTA